MADEQIKTLAEQAHEWRKREVQAIGAAISTRSWHAVEQAYNSLRDKMDRAGCWWPPKPTPAADRLTDTGEGEALGPLWRKVQQVHRDAMSNDWSVTDYRAGMAATLGIATPKPPVDAGAMRERCAKVADEIAAECEEDEQACDADDRFGADRAFGGKIEARKIAKRIRNLPDAGESL